MDKVKKMSPYELVSSKTPVIITDWDYSLLDNSECVFEVRVRSKGEDIFTYAGDFEFALEAVYFSYLLSLKSIHADPKNSDTIKVHSLRGVEIPTVGMSALMNATVNDADIDVLRRYCEIAHSLIIDEAEVA
jgi:hypothetical protein